MEKIEKDKIYNIPTVARNGWLYSKYSGIYNLINSGKLKARDVSSGKIKRYVILGSDIIDYIKKSNIN